MSGLGAKDGAPRGGAGATFSGRTGAQTSSSSSRRGGAGGGGSGARRGGAGHSEATDTLDKLLTELCNATAHRGRTPAPARRGRLGIIPENTWDAKAWTHLDRGAGDRPGESGDPGADPDDLAALGLGLGAGGDDRTSAYSRSLEYLSQSAGGGLYRSSGAGVGGFADARGAHGRIRTGDDAARDASSAAGSSSRVRPRNIGSLGSSLGPPGSAHASSTRRAGGVVGVSLREHVEAELRDKPQESFARYMRDLYGRILRLVNSPDVRRRLGGVYAIDQLTDVKMGENVGKINRFATYLRDVFTPTCEPELAEAASRALGHLVQVGGALTADVVESEVRRSLGWLQAPERVEARRYAAVLILRELAANAPTVFNVHVPAFIDAIWPALRDPRMNVRLAAVRALRECLVVIEKRETRYRVQWYYKLYEETQSGISAKMASVEQTHGSLLAFGEMLRHTGEFMLSRYKEVAETVLRLHDSRERVVRRSVVELIPKLAAFSPRRFAESYLEQSMALLLAAIQTPGERDAGFTAVGDLAAALADDDEDDDSNDDESGEGSGRGASGRGGHETGNETGNGGMSSSSGLIRGAGGFAAADKTRDGGVPAFEKYLPEITDAIQETCAARGRAANALGRRGASAAQPESGAFEALLCAGALAQSVGPAWEPHARVLLPSLFAGGLSAPLVEALEAMATALPATLPQIQRRLIDAISAVLNPGAAAGARRETQSRRRARRRGCLLPGGPPPIQPRRRGPRRRPRRRGIGVRRRERERGRQPRRRRDARGNPPRRRRDDETSGERDVRQHGGVREPRGRRARRRDTPGNPAARRKRRLERFDGRFRVASADANVAGSPGTRARLRLRRSRLFVPRRPSVRRRPRASATPPRVACTRRASDSRFARSARFRSATRRFWVLCVETRWSIWTTTTPRRVARRF